MPYDCPCRVESPSLGNTTHGTSLARRSSCGHSCGHSCRRAGCGQAPAPVPSGGERQPRPALSSPGQLPDLSVSRCAHLSAQPASGSQPCSGEQRGNGALPAGRHRAACGSPGQIPPCLRAKSQPRARQPSPTLEQGPAVCERKGHRRPWERAKRTSRWMVPKSGWDRGVKRAPVLLESRADTARAAPARCLRSLELLQRQRSSCSPADPGLHLLPVIHWWKRDTPAPLCTARCASGLCPRVCGELLNLGPGNRGCELLAAVSVRGDKYRPACPQHYPFHRTRGFAIINPGPAETDRHTLTDTSRHRKPQRFVNVY